MRRFVFGLSLVSVAGMLLLSSCANQDDVLRVASINAGAPIYCDLADWAVWNDPTIPDSEEMPFDFMYGVASDHSMFEFQYVEIGAGLPTWTPFHAEIRDYLVSYKTLTGRENPNGPPPPEDPGPYPYGDWFVPLTVTVPVEREAQKRTEAMLEVASSWWKQSFCSEGIGDSPDDNTLLDIVQADFSFTALDSVSGRTVYAQGSATLYLGDFYDDPERFGQ